MSRIGDEGFDGLEYSSYIMAEDRVQTNTRDVSVRRSGADKMRVGFVLSRDYPFFGWGPHPQSRISPPLLASPAVQNPGISRANEGRGGLRHILVLSASHAAPFPASSTDNAIPRARVQDGALLEVSHFMSNN